MGRPYAIENQLAEQHHECSTLLRTELRPLISPLSVSPPYKVPLHVLQQVLNSLADGFPLLVVV